jgi:hypothetical protein
LVFGVPFESQALRWPGAKLNLIGSVRADVMTMPDERTRALVWAGGFLIQLARDQSLPLPLRRQAVVIARHFPTIEQLGSMAISDPAVALAVPERSWSEDCRLGPLRYNTRLSWPPDER